MKGLFIVFEGIDGAGKGTAVRAAKEFLLSKGLHADTIVTTAEPTSGLFGRKLRELLAEKVDHAVNARQFLNLYIADRKEHMEKEVLPALVQGKIVLCDRYKYSTFVYQGLQGIPAQEMLSLHVGMPVPDVVFILNLPVGDAMKRISRRASRDVFERSAFLEKVRQRFLDLKSILPEENLVIVDSSKSIPVVKAVIGEVLWETIQKKEG